MGYLPDKPPLVTWKRGDEFKHEHLNHNFAVMRGWLELIMAEARAPDPVAHEAMAAIRALDRRVAALEQNVVDQQQGRAALQFLPYEVGGQLLQQINALRAELEALKGS
jgi:hypothetical protein